MATNFPSSLDNFTNPVSGNTLDSPSHSLQHSDANDAIEAIEAKLGIGNSPAGSATSGYVLMAGTGGTTTWSALPDTGGLTLVSTTTIGATVGSVSLPANTFTSTYDSYRIIMDLSTTTAFSGSSGNFNLRLRASGSDATGANYNYQGWYSTTTLATENASGATSMWFGSWLGATPTRYAAVMDIHGVALAQETKFHISIVGMNGGTNQSWGINGWHGVATSYDSLSIIVSTGTMSGGKIRVYGYKQ